MAALGKKGACVKDLVVDKFCDLVAEVVKTFYTHDAMDLYVTDYTENRGLFNYTDPDDPENLGYPSAKNWRGPYGQITIPIRLWDPHASRARQIVKEGDIVFLQNVRIKLDQDNKLEGRLHQDLRYPDKVCIMICRDPRQLAGLHENKKAWERTQARKKTDGPQNAPKKASAKASAKKKQDKKDRQRMKREQERDEAQEKLDQELENEKKKKDTRLGLNPHVRAGFPEVGISSVQDIANNPYRNTTSEEGLFVKLPFINCKYRSHVRVVDMWPTTLSDFARSRGDPNFNPHDTPQERNIRKNKFAWNFSLLVEDAKRPAKTADDRIVLVFGNTQGQNLLKLDACDLKRDPVTLKKLEEKLFVLWGNLWERKVALWKEDRIKLPLTLDDPRLQLQNRPFECCIEEFGEPVGVGGNPTDWIRRFTTFNTTIMD
ncbi:hypothetical protein P280DRAFT_512323 [Massarina eburnea CBS 473.64]|uniref:Protection of telomeres protein 1 ssDNA-binding domain-containing protein n=1 Tax=Massarina eburnea CBS 473.64 TaxID=1395130 RepID=A0A6A6SFR1_9PLEO|nr:hypothetical protein P280DRAFT_512323 [Massarina eburnea CBS 473.64]